MTLLSIIVDTREQTPWVFPEHLAACRRGTLGAGDYALEGDGMLAIERKSLDDFIGTVSSDWDRFCRELERMAAHVARIVIVEGTVGDIVFGMHNHPRVSAAFILKRVAQLTLSGVCVLFADNPVQAAGVAYAILRERYKLGGIYEAGGKDDRRSGTAMQAGSGVDLSEAGQPVDDPTACPSRLGAKVYRKRRDSVRAAPRGPFETDGDLDGIGI